MDKIKITKAAADQKVNIDFFLQCLNEAGITNKKQSGTITMAEYEKVKPKLKAGPGRTDVIVRRRNPSATEEASHADIKEKEKNDSSVQQKKNDSPEKQKKNTSEHPQKATTATENKTNKKPATDRTTAQKNESSVSSESKSTAAKKKKKKPKVVTYATILSRPGDDNSEAEQSTPALPSAQAEDSIKAEATAIPAESEKNSMGIPNDSPDTASVKELEPEQKETEKNKTGSENHQQLNEQVPSEQVAVSQPESMSSSSEDNNNEVNQQEKTEGTEKSDNSDKPAEKNSSKQKKKGKKVHEVPNARIITPIQQEQPEDTKPEQENIVESVNKNTDTTPQIPQEKTPEKQAQSNRKANQGKGKNDTSGEGKQSRRVLAASASPDDKSKPTIFSSGQEKRRDEKSSSDKKKKSQPPSIPQVKVISLPDPAQQTRSSSDSQNRRSGSRNAKDGEQRRDGNRDNNRRRDGSRDGNRMRDNNHSDMMKAAREGRDDDRERENNNRSSRSGERKQNKSSNSDFLYGQQGIGENEQSRKKRNNKGRRVMDFTSDFDDFSRHHGMLEDDDEMMRPRIRSKKPKKQNQEPVQITQPMKAAKRKIRIEESIRVSEMAHQMGIKSGEIIKVLFGLGVMATINNTLDIDTASVVASEFGYEVERVGFSEEDIFAASSSVDTPEMLKPRPPVVTIMGHVDHGKTSLLDAIRKTSVTSGEAGGITQHIGAYHVKTPRGDIVFLDTPGHAAFTAMRARGAQVTDLVVLVVAADDGVMEQTREAINHSRAANVPIMVAVNKIDKPTANPDRVLRELSELGLQAEDWGGDTVVGMVSAKTGKGLDDLLELIALQAEVLELKANPDKPAKGHVVEAKLDKGRGPVATVLVQEGTLHQGDVFVCGVFAGRVRALFNDQGKKIKEAGPSIPVEVQGFEGVPEAGEEFICLEDEKTARRIADSRAVKLREKELSKISRVTLENFLSQKADSQEALVLNVVLKADVQGSVEAIAENLRKLSTDKVHLNIIHGGAGAISESDIMLASASNAIIIGFNVRPTAKVKEVAVQEQVDIRFYDVIYKLVDEIKSAMAGLLAPVSKEVYLGQAEIRQTFSVPKVGLIAGCMVTDGKMTRTAHIRLLRDGVVVHNGQIASLKRMKDDAKEVLHNFECGIGLDNFHDIKVGDIIEAYDVVEEAASLD